MTHSKSHEVLVLSGAAFMVTLCYFFFSGIMHPISVTEVVFAAMASMVACNLICHAAMEKSELSHPVLFYLGMFGVNYAATMAWFAEANASDPPGVGYLLGWGFVISFAAVGVIRLCWAIAKNL